MLPAVVVPETVTLPFAFTVKVTPFFVALAAVVLVVSVPSAVLAYFKLRKRDLGAILNASGWAINRPMRFSMRRARDFTKRRSLFA